MNWRQWLSFCLGLFTACIVRADTMIGDIADGLDHASTGIVHALHQISLIVGVVLIIRSLVLFKKYTKEPQSVSFIGALWWGVLGIALVLVYFFV